MSSEKSKDSGRPQLSAAHARVRVCGKHTEPLPSKLPKAMKQVKAMKAMKLTKTMKKKAAKKQRIAMKAMKKRPGRAVFEPHELKRLKVFGGGEEAEMKSEEKRQASRAYHHVIVAKEKEGVSHEEAKQAGSIAHKEAVKRFRGDVVNIH